MDFASSAEDEAFRARIRGWLATELPAHRTDWPPTDDEFTLPPDRSFDACRACHRPSTRAAGSGSTGRGSTGAGAPG